MRYKRLVQAAAPSCDEGDQKTLGPRLYKNLLGLNSSISLLIEQEDPNDFKGEEGANMLLDFLETKRFNRSALRDLPRAFDEFFEETAFQKKGPEPMAGSILYGHGGEQG